MSLSGRWAGNRSFLSCVWWWSLFFLQFPAGNAFWQPFSVRSTTALPAQKPKPPLSFRPPSQTRRKHAESRRPRYYWTNLTNVRRELKQFWQDLGIDSTCIPNEILLNYFQRHDIRAAIVSHGGRHELAQLLGRSRDVPIMPGKWTDAVNTSPEVKLLLQNSSFHHWSTKVSPLSPFTQKTNQTTTTTSSSTRRWSHQPNRNQHGYWSSPQTILEELYDYLDDYQSRYGRPAIWMPQPVELKHQGRHDLHQALYSNNNGGPHRILAVAGLVPYKEWSYFEGQYELFVRLRNYLDRYHHSNYLSFPCVSEIQQRGETRLHRLIQYYGGRKFLESRLGMTTTNTKTTTTTRFSMNWGEFSLEFAIRLCEFIRNDHMRVKPPVLPTPVIRIPSPARLSRAGTEGLWLHQRILQYGGYENVARRLYLGYQFQPSSSINE